MPFWLFHYGFVFSCDLDCIVIVNFGSHSVTMQAQKEAPPDMQCKDKFLLQSVKAYDGATAKDISAEMVITCYQFFCVQFFNSWIVDLWSFGCVVQ